jgi:hypothetical protein
MMWSMSHRYDVRALPLADRHYNRRKVGSPQFVPPGRNICLLNEKATALWVTSWPYGEYVRHDWPGAWVNSLFRKECPGPASAMITAAVAATRKYWPVPEQGIVSFVDPEHVPGVLVRGERIFGYCYLRAGWQHVGFTRKEGLWVWQLLPGAMPPALAPIGMQQRLFE